MSKRRMCPNCRAFVDTSERVCPYCEASLGARAIDQRMPGEILGGLIPHARFTTVMILLLNAGLYIATAIVSMQYGNSEAFLSIDARTLFDFGAKFPPAVFAGEWWRLVTAGFLHGGLLHIAMNSWVLFDLGAQVEEFYGTPRYLVIYFVSTVTGFLASTYWSASVSVGASAGLFGLIGAMIAVGIRSDSALAAAIRGTYIRWAVYMLLFSLLPGLRIDFAAHLGGLAGGFAIAYLAGERKLILETAIERLWRFAAAACLVITAGCFGLMILRYTASSTP